MTETEFVTALNDLGYNISEYQLSQFKEYYKLLIEWNSKINLTRIVEEKEVYLKHFYDSATIIKAINLEEINELCDFGTGAGFPGIVIKILFPKLNITLVDSLNKRINFLNVVINKLNLENVVAIHSRIEDYARNNIEKFDVVVARAVAKLNILLEYSVPLIKLNGYFVAMKANIEEELEESKNAIDKLSVKIEKIEKFLLPKENSNRSIILFYKEKKTLNTYPRRTSEILSKPL